MQPAYGIIVPLRNEAAVLPSTVPKLLAATQGDAVRIIWVCNGCSDDSAAVIRQYAGETAEIIKLAAAGKTAALQAGDDAMGDLFPRIYLDADTWLRPSDPSRLIQPLLSGAADLVAPKLCFDTAGASPVSARIGACWLSLPHAGEMAFSNAIGLSAAGRALWGRWPEITGDDIFISANVPANRKQIVREALATTAMPRSFLGWVSTRARWLRGEAELARLGLRLPRPSGQRFSLLRQMILPQTALGAWAFVLARLLARIVRNDTPPSTWVPERSLHRG